MHPKTGEGIMLDKVGKYEFMAEPFHCDFSKRIFMGHLGNHLLNAADFHSNDRNFGMNYLNTGDASVVHPFLCGDVGGECHAFLHQP